MSNDTKVFAVFVTCALALGVFVAGSCGWNAADVAGEYCQTRPWNPMPSNEIPSAEDLPYCR